MLRKGARFGSGRKAIRAGALFLRFAAAAATYSGTSFIARAQATASNAGTNPPHSETSERPAESEHAPLISLLAPLKSQTLDEPYHPMTSQQNFRWFVTNTVGPSHLAGGTFWAAAGTGLDRPKEYGPHWEGFADRYGMQRGGVAASNAMEATASSVLHEDPRYFRVPGAPFKARVGNVVRLTFEARRRDGAFGPASARYIAIFGSSFLSNTWRVRGEANTRDALVRSSESFAGRLAANAFEEFWPDIKKHFISALHPAARRAL